MLYCSMVKYVSCNPVSPIPPAPATQFFPLLQPQQPLVQTMTLFIQFLQHAPATTQCDSASLPLIDITNNYVLSYVLKGEKISILSQKKKKKSIIKRCFKGEKCDILKSFLIALLTCYNAARTDVLDFWQARSYLDHCVKANKSTIGCNLVP